MFDQNPPAGAARRTATVERTQLVERLVANSANGVTMLVAPAGYGKSVVLQQCVQRLQNPTLYVNIRGDVSSADFVHAVGTALREGPRERGGNSISVEVSAGVRHDVVAPDESLSAAITDFDGVVLVDNIHRSVSRSASFRQTLIRLVEQSLPSTSWFLAVRGVADFPVARWLSYEIMAQPTGVNELRLRREEAIAWALGTRGTPAGYEVPLELGGGWAAAFGLAQKLLQVNSSEAKRDLHATIIAAYRGETFDLLSPEERDFTLKYCMFPQVELQLDDDGFAEDIRIMSVLRDYHSVVRSEGTTRFRFDELFREIAVDILRTKSFKRYNRRLVAVGASLESRGLYEDALRIAIERDAHDDVRRLLAAHAFNLILQGRAQVVAAALQTLPAAAVQTGTLVSAAMIASYEAQFDKAERLFLEALETSNATERISVACAFIYDAFRTGRPIDSALLSNLAVAFQHQLSIDSSVQERANLLAIFSLIQIRLGDGPAASRCMDDALRLSGGLGVQSMTLLHLYACYVRRALGDDLHAQSHLALAERSAQKGSLTGTISQICHIRAFSLLSMEDSIARLHLLERGAAAADAADDRFLAIAFHCAAAEIKMDRGDDCADSLRALVVRCGAPVQRVIFSLQSMLAIKQAWQGDYNAAADSLAGTAEKELSALFRAMRWSEVALYSAMGGNRERALDTAATALEAIKSVGRVGLHERRERVRSLVFCALALLISGKVASANSVLRELELSHRDMPPQSKALVLAARALHMSVEAPNTDDITPSLDGLDNAGLGGIARLLRTLPLGEARPTSFLALLTGAEIAVLRLLARGGSSRDVARSTQRSVNTINVHVKSIMKKLNCSRRHEALALARELGLIS